MTVQEMEERLEQNNPIERLASLASSQVRILHVHGDSDDIVPLEQNSGMLINRYRALGEMVG